MWCYVDKLWIMYVIVGWVITGLVRRDTLVFCVLVDVVNIARQTGALLYFANARAKSAAREL
jgi:hypothetical protein